MLSALRLGFAVRSTSPSHRIDAAEQSPRPPEAVAQAPGAAAPQVAEPLAARGALAAELLAVRDRGWAVNDAESAAGLRCVAAAVRDETGAVTRALSVSG